MASTWLKIAVNVWVAECVFCFLQQHLNECVQIRTQVQRLWYVAQGEFGRTGESEGVKTA